MEKWKPKKGEKVTGYNIKSGKPVYFEIFDINKDAVEINAVGEDEKLVISVEDFHELFEPYSGE